MKVYPVDLNQKQRTSLMQDPQMAKFDRLLTNFQLIHFFISLGKKKGCNYVEKVCRERPQYKNSGVISNPYQLYLLFICLFLFAHYYILILSIHLTINVITIIKYCLMSVKNVKTKLFIILQQSYQRLEVPSHKPFTHMTESIQQHQQKNYNGENNRQVLGSSSLSQLSLNFAKDQQQPKSINNSQLEMILVQTPQNSNSQKQKSYHAEKNKNFYANRQNEDFVFYKTSHTQQIFKNSQSYQKWCKKQDQKLQKLNNAHQLKIQTIKKQREVYVKKIQSQTQIKIKKIQAQAQIEIQKIKSQRSKNEFQTQRYKYLRSNKQFQTKNLAVNMVRNVQFEKERKQQIREEGNDHQEDFHQEDSDPKVDLREEKSKYVTNQEIQSVYDCFKAAIKQDNVNLTLLAEEKGRSRNTIRVLWDKFKAQYGYVKQLKQGRPKTKKINKEKKMNEDEKMRMSKSD